jgi:hypothetical protein
MMAATLKTAILALCMTGCISVNLSNNKLQKAAGIKFQSPEAPFEKASGENVDQIWRNPKNGNAISFLSDCSDSSDPSLVAIEQGVLSGLYPYSYESQTQMTFDGRAARKSRIKGTVDGVASIVDLMVYKKNNCIYILSYVGLQQKHAEDQKRFDTFVERFHAP